MGRLWALTFTPDYVMPLEFCQRGATVDTPFLTVLKTWAPLIVYLVVKDVQCMGSISSARRESNPNFIPLFDQNNLDQNILDLETLSFKMFWKYSSYDVPTLTFR